MKKKPVVLVLGAVAALTACGGSDDPTSEVPVSANHSVEQFVSYHKALITSEADALEPVDVSKVTPPTDETSEPQVVD